MWKVTRGDELQHYGVPKMEWGKRRWQNKDGSLTPEGRIHYGVGMGRKASTDDNRNFSKTFNKANSGSHRATNKLLKSDQMKNLINDDELKRKYARSKIATEKWLKKSDGDDYDAFDPDKNGYDKNYGITEKEFEEIRKLDDERREAQKDFTDSLQKKAKEFIDSYNENASAEDLIKSRGDDTQAEQWLSKQMQKAIRKDFGYYDALQKEKEHVETEEKLAKNKNHFNSAKETIKKKGLTSWWNDNKLDTDESEGFFNYVFDSQKEILDKWWKERYSASVEDGSWDRLQQKYVKQIAKNLDLPQTKETYYFLTNWFVNGDD